MNEKDEEIIKKFQNIDKAKEDIINIEKFEEIYSNFQIKNISPKIPKIIKDEEPSSIMMNDDNNFLDDNNFFDKNLTYFIDGNQFLGLDKSNEKENSKDNNKSSRTHFESKKEALSQKRLQKKIQRNLENKKGDKIINEKEIKRKRFIQMIEIIKKNKPKRKKSLEKSHISKIYNSKYIKNKKDYQHNRKKSMKDIYQYIYGIKEDDISLSTDKRGNIKNAFQRLYNQGFYVKNKSQINIIENINKIKKESKRENISQKSKQILGLSKDKKTEIKYEKNNIYKPIKTNMESSYKKFSFHPKISESTKKLVKNKEKSYMRISKSKTKKKIEFKKRSISKEKYEKILKRINFLYLDGVEKLKKKKKLKSCPPSENAFIEFKENSSNIDLNKIINLKNKQNSRNIYYNQIQWKKKLLLENENKKKIEEDIKNRDCSFKPQINKKSIKYLFQKKIDDNIKTKTNKNFNSYSLNKSLKSFKISPKRYFLINKNGYDNDMNNNIVSKIKEKVKEDKMKSTLIQRKAYNLEKFFHNKYI